MNGEEEKTVVTSRRPKAVIYVAHEVRGDEVTNLKRSIDLIRTLTILDPSRIYIAPWIAEVSAFLGQPVPEDMMERILQNDEEIARRCDGVVAFGPRVSEGMARELEVANKKLDYTNQPMTLEHLDAALKEAGL